MASGRIDDEHRLIARYAACLAEGLAASTWQRPIGVQDAKPSNREQLQLIADLENKNREILREIQRLKLEADTQNRILANHNMTLPASAAMTNSFHDYKTLPSLSQSLACDHYASEQRLGGTLSTSGFLGDCVRAGSVSARTRPGRLLAAAASRSNGVSDPALILELRHLRQRKDDLEGRMTDLQDSRRDLMLQLDGLMKMLKTQSTNSLNRLGATEHFAAPLADDPAAILPTVGMGIPDSSGIPTSALTARRGHHSTPGTPLVERSSHFLPLAPPHTPDLSMRSASAMNDVTTLMPEEAKEANIDSVCMLPPEASADYSASGYWRGQFGGSQLDMGGSNAALFGGYGGFGGSGYSTASLSRSSLSSGLSSASFAMETGTASYGNVALKNDLLLAADSITAAMSSLVSQLNDVAGDDFSQSDKPLSESHALAALKAKPLSNSKSPSRLAAQPSSTRAVGNHLASANQRSAALEMQLEPTNELSLSDNGRSETNQAPYSSANHNLNNHVHEAKNEKERMLIGGFALEKRIGDQSNGAADCGAESDVDADHDMEVDLR